MNKTSKILIIIITTGLIISAINLFLQTTIEQNFRGYKFERIVYWVTLIAIFVFALRKPFRKYRKLFFAFFPLFLLIQCSQIFTSHNISTIEQIKINDNYALKNGTSLISIPIISIYEINSLLEKEVSCRIYHLKNTDIITLSKVESIKLLNKNDSIFTIRLYLNNGYIDQIIKKTVANNGIILQYYHYRET